MSLNKVMLIGNVGMDPEVRYLDNSQTKVARIRLATTERYTDRNGEVRENTEWHTISCWRRLADTVERFVKKGSQIYVEGRLQTREWTDNTGAKRYSTEISADNIQLLGKRESNPGQQAVSTPAGPGGYQAPYQPQTTMQPNLASPAPAQSAATQGFDAEGSDDLPF
ncbi:MAG: single-stranded DNA-binding protein [Bacteroidales bacterium]|nr:single-stranded DNA-binding protein [Candidatus Hennigimonas equi]